jgi:hypothetical protein
MSKLTHAINFKYLEQNLSRFSKEFCREPFRYLVIDNFLIPEIAEKILEEFPVIGDDWVDGSGLHSQKKWTQPIVNSGKANIFFHDIHSNRFVNFMSQITGISGIIGDPDLSGAGYHQTINGGFLNVHIDFNRLEHNYSYDRRINLIVYFNKDWSEENGGWLELWDMENNIMIENICPEFNRCVIFETNEVSYHGHPKPVKVDKNQSRKSLSVYYYTKGREDIPYIDTHNTMYRNTESITGVIRILGSGVKNLIKKVKAKISNSQT